MRAELPPVCRFMAPAVANHQQDAALEGRFATTFSLGANHRACADAEEKLLWLVSKHSLARLAESLSDPLLKLDEVNIIARLVCGHGRAAGSRTAGRRWMRATWAPQWPFIWPCTLCR